MSVGIETEPSFALGRSGPLFATAPYVNVTGATLCRVPGSADGRFLLLKEGGGSEGAAAAQSIVIVQNWFEELKALVPVK